MECVLDVRVTNVVYVIFGGFMRQQHTAQGEDLQ